MGWASGSRLFGKVIEAAKSRMSDRERKDFYKEVIDAFEDSDWDTQDECLGADPMFDEALREFHPGWYSDD